jgi:phospholipid/cholesterol/gamma-HCH transport system substrate-binding protein
MATRGARNNILAGLFVIGAIVLGVLVSFRLSSRTSMGGTRRFTVRFSLLDGATGLKNGSPVQLAGQQIGQVRSVEFSTGPGGVVSAVDVGVEVRADLTLYENAGIYLQLPLLGTLSSINISSVGDDKVSPFSGKGPAIEDNEVVIGHLAPPGFLAQAGFGSEQAAQLRATISSLQSAVDRASRLLETSGPKLDGALSDAQTLLAQLKEKLSGWTEKIDKTAANIEQASSRLDPMLTKVDNGLDDARATIKDVREIVESNRDKVGQIVDNVRSATEKIDKTTVDQINAALKDGREALDVFSKSLTKLGDLITQETPDLRRTLANLRLMSDQLKLTAVEVRSQPWRLLHEPTTKEMSSQVLYDAARSYAEAASDLRAASESLEATKGQPAAEVMDELSRAVTKYKAAEQALMDKLIENDKK